MPTFFIQSARDPRLSAYGAVSDPRSLAESGLFVAEGRLVVERLLTAGCYAIESVLLNEAAHLALAPIVAQRSPSTLVYVGPRGLFEELTGHDFHRGCLALVRRPLPCSASALFESSGTLVVLEGVANPDNLGSVFRNAAAFGAGGILLGPGCSDPLYRKAIRTSMGATLGLRFAAPDASVDGPWPSVLERLRDHGFELLALTPREPALDIEEYRAMMSPTQRIALLVGAEGAGLSPATMGLARHRLRIAIRSEIDSLNLAVATGIALQRLTQGQRSF